MKYLLLFISISLQFGINAQTELRYFDLSDELIPNNGIYPIDGIIFDYDYFGLREESKNQLDEVAYFLLYHPELKVEFRTHTDSRGNDKFNETLSQQRSQAIVDYCESEGVPLDQMIAKGFGESLPYTVRSTDHVKCSGLKTGEQLTESYIQTISNKTTAECAYQLNRRVEMVIIEGGVKIPVDTIKVGDLMKMSEVRFDLGSKNIQLNSDSSIVNLAKQLRYYPNLVVEIGHHSDCRGSAMCCSNLTQARAVEIKKRLVELGIEEDRLIPVGYGESQPTSYQGQVLSCEYINQFRENKEQFERLHQMNRRTEIKVLSKDFSPIEIRRIELSDFDSTGTYHLYNIQYDLGKYNFKPISQPQVQEVANFMERNPNLVLEIKYHFTGYQSSTSSISKAQRRADTLVSYLVKYGINENRIVPKGITEGEVNYEQVLANPRCFENRKNNYACSWLELVILSKEFVEPKSEIKSTNKVETDTNGIIYDFD